MMAAALEEAKGADIYISAAAISDFKPERAKGKIPSGTATTIRLDPLPKVLDAVLGVFSGTAVAFKLGWDEEARAKAMLASGVAMVVTNTPPAMGAAAGEFVIMTTERSERVAGTKEEVAAAIWSALL